MFWCCWWNYTHKTHLKGAFSFSGILNPAFLFMEEIWHDVKKGSGSILSPISSQSLEVSPANNDMVDLWPYLWCNNSKAILFLDVNLFVFDISFISPKNEYFLCALCGKVTKFLFLAPKSTMQNHFWNKQVCTEFINVKMENNLSHKSGAKSTLFNVEIKVSPLSLQIFISTWHFCFAVMWCLSATSICLSVSSN